jgi:hypothetical protein
LTGVLIEKSPSLGAVIWTLTCHSVVVDHSEHVRLRDRALPIREHVALTSVVSPALGISMFAIASRFLMTTTVITVLLGAATLIFCSLEWLLGPRHRLLLRGMATSAVFTTSLMSALWFTTGHPGVLMWTVFATAAATSSATLLGRRLLT